MNREITQAITEDNQMLIEVKDTLYRFYYEFLSEVKGKKVIPPDDYDYNLSQIKFITLLHYIKETVNILINQKTKQIQPVPLTDLEKEFHKL